MGRKFGQHFLVRQSILERIAAAACPEGTDTVVEIGPGRGALTAHLLPRASRLIAIEIDPVLVQYLRAKFRNEPKFTLIEGDVLKTDLGGWGTIAVAGNLPYYISSPILQKTLSLRSQLSQAVLMVQKEVALRLIAGPGSRDYGFLSVQTQLLATAELLFDVPADAFRPPPKVDSAVVRLTPRPDSPVPGPEAFLRFASHCFRQKRKKVRNNLSGLYDLALLDSLPATAKRAEQLSIQDLADLYAALTEKARTGPEGR